MKKALIAVLLMCGMAIGTGGVYAADGGFAVPIALNAHTEMKATTSAMATPGTCYEIKAVKTTSFHCLIRAAARQLH